MLNGLLRIDGFNAEDSPEYQAVIERIQAQTNDVNITDLTRFLNNPTAYMAEDLGIKQDHLDRIHTLMADSSSGVDRGNYSQAKEYYENRDQKIEDDKREIDDDRHYICLDNDDNSRQEELDKMERNLKRGIDDNQDTYTLLENEERELNTANKLIQKEIDKRDRQIKRLDDTLNRDDPPHNEDDLRQQRDALVEQRNVYDKQQTEIIKREEQIKLAKEAIDEARESGKILIEDAKKQLEKDKKTVKRYLNNEKRELPALIKAADQLAKASDKPSEYDSPRAILEATVYYLHRYHPPPDKKANNLKDPAIQREVDIAINRQRGPIETRQRGRIRGLEWLLTTTRPTLKQTLRSLSHQDDTFANIGEDPEKELTKLVPFFGNPSESSVREWVRHLPKSADKKAVVSKLLAYLEYAVRVGRVNSVIDFGATNALIEGLRVSQREMIRKEVVDEGLNTPQEQMLSYIKKLNEAARAGNDIDEEIITNNATWATGKTLGVAGVGAASAATMALSSAVALPLAGAVTAMGVVQGISYYLNNNLPDSERTKVAQKTKRYLLYGGLATTGALLWAPLAVALPLIPFVPRAIRALKEAKLDSDRLLSGKGSRKQLKEKN